MMRMKLGMNKSTSLNIKKNLSESKTLKIYKIYYVEKSIKVKKISRKLLFMRFIFNLNK